MKVYTAGSTQERDRCRRFNDKLRFHGHIISYDWTGPQKQWRDDSDYAIALAHAERYGVDDADALVLLWPRGEIVRRGPEACHARAANGDAIILVGALLECGGALWQRKKIIVVGGPESLFFCLPEVTLVEDEDDALAELSAC